jgi:hypothetical protein
LTLLSLRLSLSSCQLLSLEHLHLLLDLRVLCALWNAWRSRPAILRSRNVSTCIRHLSLLSRRIGRRDRRQELLLTRSHIGDWLTIGTHSRLSSTRCSRLSRLTWLSQLPRRSHHLTALLSLLGVEHGCLLLLSQSERTSLLHLLLSSLTVSGVFHITLPFGLDQVERGIYLVHQVSRMALVYVNDLFRLVLDYDYSPQQTRCKTSNEGVDSL